MDKIKIQNERGKGKWTFYDAKDKEQEEEWKERNKAPKLAQYICSCHVLETNKWKKTKRNQKFFVTVQNVLAPLMH